MRLSKARVQKFAEAWQADFGEPLALDQARVELTRLLTFFLLMAESVRARPRRPEKPSPDRDSMAS